MSRDLDIRSRIQWGARNPHGRLPILEPPAKCRGWAVHWNGPPMKTDDIDSEMRKVRGIQDFHMNTKRWSDIAYSFLIGQTGTIYEGRGWGWDQFANGDDEVAPFTEKGNKGWRSVCWLGGEGQKPTSAVIRVHM